jgi:hypothetical protein
MANAIYPVGRQAFLEGAIAFLTDTISVVLVDSNYTFNLADTVYANVSANVVSANVNLASKSSTNGNASSANLTFSAVAAPSGGRSAKFAVFFKNTGSSTTANLIACFDTATGSPGLPVTPNGGDINLQFSTGPGQIFQL